MSEGDGLPFAVPAVVLVRHGEVLADGTSPDTEAERVTNEGAQMVVPDVAHIRFL